MKSEKLKEALYAQVLELLKKRGNEKWSISELCTKLSISRDTLYRIIDSKELVIRDTMKYYFERHLKRMQVIAESDVEYSEGLREMIEAVSVFVCAFEGIEIKSYPDLIEDNAFYISEILKCVSSYIERGMSLGVLRKVLNAGFIAEFIHRGIVDIFSKSEKRQEDIEVFLDILLYGIMKK